MSVVLVSVWHRDQAVDVRLSATAPVADIVRALVTSNHTALHLPRDAERGDWGFMVGHRRLDPAQPLGAQGILDGMILELRGRRA